MTSEPQSTPSAPLEQSEHERVRRNKRDQILARGIDPYGSPFPRRETIASLRERTAALTPETLPDPAPQARIAGRIVLMRKFGKAFFATLQDEGEER